MARLSARAGHRSRLLLVALVVGLCIRIAVLVTTRDLGTTIIDEQHYAALAASILKGDGFADAPRQPTSIRPPLYPALVSAIWSLAGTGNLQAVRVFQILLALVTTTLVYQLGRQLYSRDVGAIAAATFWLYPNLIFFNFLILTETLFTLLLVTFVLLAVMLIQTPRSGVALACGLALGLAALARSVLWPLPLVLCPLLAALLRVPTRARVVLPALVFAGYLVPILPWAIRNTRLQGVVEIVDTMGGINLRMGNYEYTPDDRMWDAVSLTGERNWVHGIGNDFPGRVPTEGEKDKWAQRKAIEYMRAHPRTTARRSFIRFADFWGIEREFIAGVQQGLFSPPTWIAVLAALLIAVAYIALASLGGAALWLAPPPDWRAHVLLLLPMLAIIGIHTVVFGHSRYHLPLVPILAVYTAALVSRGRLTWSTSRARRLGAALTVAALLIVWAREIAFSDATRIRAVIDRLL